MSCTVLPPVMQCLPQANSRRSSAGRISRTDRPSLEARGLLMHCSYRATKYLHLVLSEDATDALSRERKQSSD